MVRRPISFRLHRRGHRRVPCGRGPSVVFGVTAVVTILPYGMLVSGLGGSHERACAIGVVLGLILLSGLMTGGVTLWFIAGQA